MVRVSITDSIRIQVRFSFSGENHMETQTSKDAYMLIYCFLQLIFVNKTIQFIDEFQVRVQAEDSNILIKPHN